MAETLRIAVLDIAASKTGALSVLRDFYSCVSDLNDGNEWYFITGVEGLIEERADRQNIRVIVREDVKRSRFKRLLFDRFTGSSFLKELKADVIISFQNTLPAGAESFAKTVIYLHQPLGFQNIRKFSFFNKWERGLAVYQYLIAPEIDRSLKRADRVIVQTEWMKKAVIEKDAVSPEKIAIAAPDVKGVAELCKPNVKRNSSLFIFPAGSILYKNHQCIIDAADILALRGIKDFRVIFTEKEADLPWLRISEESRGVTEWRGMIEREELIGLYQEGVLLFPSYIETFGYPLAEARAAGAPVIAADTAFSREILSGYGKAVFFPPFSPEKLADVMESSIKGKGFFGEISGEVSGEISGEKTEEGEEFGAVVSDTEDRSSWEKVVDIILKTCSGDCSLHKD